MPPRKKKWGPRTIPLAPVEANPDVFAGVGGPGGSLQEDGGDARVLRAPLRPPAPTGSLRHRPGERSLSLAFGSAEARAAGSALEASPAGGAIRLGGGGDPRSSRLHTIRGAACSRIWEPEGSGRGGCNGRAGADPRVLVGVLGFGSRRAEARRTRGGAQPLGKSKPEWGLEARVKGAGMERRHRVSAISARRANDMLESCARLGMAGRGGGRVEFSPAGDRSRLSPGRGSDSETVGPRSSPTSVRDPSSRKSP